MQKCISFALGQKQTLCKKFVIKLQIRHDSSWLEREKWQ